MTRECKGAASWDQDVKDALSLGKECGFYPVGMYVRSKMDERLKVGGES